MCAEHGVLEALCTKCNPRLSAVFQAKGDWCAEHGFPESFCPTCHPERGGKPRVALAENDGPASGTVVQLASPETARTAGIETELALAVEASSELEVLGTIAHDAAHRAQVDARVAGVVRELLVDLGARVEAGQALARIDSPDVAAARARLGAAALRVETAKTSLERLTSLSAQELTTRRSLEEARLELEAAQGELAALSGGLASLGAEPETGGLHVVRAPIGGMVVRRAGAIGQKIEAATALYEIVDSSVVWAELDVPEAELVRVRAGLEVVVTSDSLPGREFQGRIDHVAPEIDVHTRTAKARVRLENPEGLLRANQFVRARVVVERLGARVRVPRDALQRAERVQLVFVELEPGRYEARRVVPLGGTADLVELARGIEPGERVVTRGSFLLKTETLKGAIGAGCCAVD